MERRPRYHFEESHDGENSISEQHLEEEIGESASLMVGTRDRRRPASQMSSRSRGHQGLPSNIPINVKDAARFLGVSPQTVYLWVERKQIPHFRVMGRNIRFLRSDLEPFRAQFRQEVANAETA